ncbi:hypothetical protein MKZ38_009606 [Zalerion maritima]|uniref:Uncharacterized protein n=1 Tax=Zalerion maritima TaxID=339359 RepID=A0AAD5RH06_9PEZI|nr:hypothetical protein MKZ38_009606 [Zalerion maritima]
MLILALAGLRKSQSCTFAEDPNYNPAVAPTTCVNFNSHFPIRDLALPFPSLLLHKAFASLVIVVSRWHAFSYLETTQDSKRTSIIAIQIGRQDFGEGWSPHMKA